MTTRVAVGDFACVRLDVIDGELGYVDIRINFGIDAGVYVRIYVCGGFATVCAVDAVLFAGHAFTSSGSAYGWDSNARETKSVDPRKVNKVTIHPHHPLSCVGVKPKSHRQG